MGMMILKREFWVSGLREYTAIKSIFKSASDVSFLAKIKTTSIYCYWLILFSFSIQFKSWNIYIFIHSFFEFTFLLKTGIDLYKLTLRLK